MPSLVTGIIGGITGSSAAHHAANAQVTGYGDAGTSVNNAVNKANDTITNAFGNAEANVGNAYTNTAGLVNPYLSLGGTAAGTLQQLTTPGANISALMKTLDPSYNFRLSEGLTGVQQSAAASGLLQSGAAARGLNNYAQNFASNEYANTFNRLAGLAQMGNQTSQYLGDQGFRGALQTGQWGTQLGSEQAQNTIGAGVYQGNADIGIGQARAGGIVGGQNAWNGTLSSIGNFANGLALAGLPAGGGGGWSFSNIGPNLWGGGAGGGPVTNYAQMSGPSMVAAMGPPNLQPPPYQG